jgi:glutaredoxin
VRGQSPPAATDTSRRDSGDCPRPDVVLYHAQGCHLCERARTELAALRKELDFDLREVDITGDDELEARYRELLPVVEIDGERAFVYYVQPEGFRRRLAAQSRSKNEGS